MKFYPRLFLKEALLFGSTLALGIFTAWNYLPTILSTPTLAASSLTVGDLVSLVIAILLIWLLSRIPRVGGWMFWIFLVFLILAGSQVVFNLFSPLTSLILTLILLALFLLVRNVFTHDLAIIIAIAGLGASIGLFVTPNLVLIALIVLSFYDIIAVYKTKHMVQMARTMIGSGAIFGFVIPSSFNQFWSSRREAMSKIGGEFAILGSGDIGLPVIFTSALIRQSLAEAIFVAVFAMLGLLVTHILFVSQKERRPMAALPPIATLTIIGYVLTMILKI